MIENLEELMESLGDIWLEARATASLTNEEVIFGTLAYAVAALKASGMPKERMLKAASQSWDLSE